VEAYTIEIQLARSKPNLTVIQTAARSIQELVIQVSANVLTPYVVPLLAMVGLGWMQLVVLRSDGSKSGAVMTDAEFISLSAVRANKALQSISDPREIARLQDLILAKEQWNRRPHGRKPKAFCWGLSGSPVLWSANSQLSESHPSRMLFWGRIVFSIGLMGSVGSWFWMTNSDDLFMKVRLLTAIYLFGAVISLGAFMWMLGAIEERLIEVRTALAASGKSRATQPLP
jgi:hypothetical protein